MRQKDAEAVATVLGNEFRLCAKGEEEGLLVALYAIDGHMRHVHPEYDPQAFGTAFSRARGLPCGVIDPPELQGI